MFLDRKENPILFSPRKRVVIYFILCLHFLGNHSWSPDKLRQNCITSEITGHNCMHIQVYKKVMLKQFLSNFWITRISVPYPTQGLALLTKMFINDVYNTIVLVGWSGKQENNNVFFLFLNITIFPQMWFGLSRTNDNYALLTAQLNKKECIILIYVEKLRNWMIHG